MGGCVSRKSYLPMSMEFSSFSDKYKESKERMQELRTEATVSNELYEKEKTRCEYLEEVLVSTKLEHLVDLKEIMQYLETGVQPDQERFFHADEIKSHILHRASALTATTAANEAGPSERRLLSSADGFPSISTVHSSRSPIDPVRATEWRRLAPLNLHSCVAQPFRKLSPLIESDREMACSLLRSQSFQRAIDLGQADDSEDGSKVTSQVTSPMSEAASTIQERPPSATTLSDTSDVEKSTEWNQTCRVQLADEMQRSIVQRKTAFRRNEDNLSEKDSDEYCNINNNNEFEVKSEGDEPHQRGLRHLFNDSSSDTCDSISSPTRDTVSSPDESCDRPFMRASRLTRTPEVDTDASEGDVDGTDIKSDILQGIEEISSNNSESIAKFAATRRTRKLTAAPGLSRLQPISDIQESQESFESEVSTAASDSLINSIDSEVSEKEPSQAFSADFIAKLRDISTLTDEAKIEDAFNRLALNFRTDCETVASREEVTSRARELAELNVENEFTLMTAMLNKALGNGELTEEVRESFQELIRCVKILRQSCERVSRTAEFVGVVRQETRASEAVAVMIKFLESLRGVTQRQNAEIRELKNLLQEHNIIPSFDTVFPDLSLGPYAVDARTINRERRLSRTIPMTAARRRQSEAVLPSTSRFGMDMRIQLQNLARRGSIRPRGVSDTDVTEADEPFESTVNRKMPPSRGESTDRESSATDKELKPAAPATSWRAKLRRECLRFCDAVKRRTPFSQRLRLVSLGFGFFLVLLCILLTLFPTGSLAPNELHELSGTLFDRVVHKPLPQ